MYNTNYECRYHKEDIFLPTDNIDDDEKEHVRDILYKEDMLSIFSIFEEHQFSKIDKEIESLYNKVKNCDDLKECMTYAAAKFFSEDEQTGLCVLYAYDYMYLTHSCVCEYLEEGVISEQKLLLLKEKLMGK